MFPISEHAGGSVNSNGDILDNQGLDGRTTRWASHRKARRIAMIRETRAIIHELGPHISMEEIAVGLGTSKSVLYRYFGDKNGLQAALGNYTLERTKRHLVEASRSHVEAELALRAMVSTYLEIVGRSRNVFLFVNLPSGRGPLQSLVEQIEEMVSGVVGAEADGVDPVRLSLWAASAVGLVRAAAERWAEIPEDARIDLEELSDDLNTMLWRGTKALITAVD